jgi:hypothetical protein
MKKFTSLTAFVALFVASGPVLVAKIRQEREGSSQEKPAKSLKALVTKSETPLKSRSEKIQANKFALSMLHKLDKKKNYKTETYKLSKPGKAGKKAKVVGKLERFAGKKICDGEFSDSVVKFTSKYHNLFFARTIGTYGYLSEDTYEKIENFVDFVVDEADDDSEKIARNSKRSKKNLQPKIKRLNRILGKNNKISKKKLIKKKYRYQIDKILLEILNESGYRRTIIGLSQPLIKLRHGAKLYVKRIPGGSAIVFQSRYYCSLLMAFDNKTDSDSIFSLQAKLSKFIDIDIE